jgi:CRP-like cAMP-binding protein
MANVRLSPARAVCAGRLTRILLLSSGVPSDGRGVSFRAGPGFALGALEAVGQVPRWYEAQALTPVVALQGQTDVLVDLFEDSFEMATDFLAVVAGATLRILDWSAAQAAQPLDG